MNTLAIDSGDAALDRRIDIELDLAQFGAPAGTRVVVAMSGGVDSSVAAALLKARGYDVVGVTLQLYDQGAAAGRKGACCAGRDIQDARAVADTLDVPHYVLDYEARFRREVVDDFADSYLRGETPIPCVRCNQSVKFRDLAAMARDLGGAALVTGHYARRLPGGDGVELHRGIDPARDQSYFLFATTRAQLDFARFPLGGLDKTETRALAERYRLPVAAKPDSQDICFVPQGKYSAVVERLRPGAAQPGEIVDRRGSVLGQHAGIQNFTIGQRRGLRLDARSDATQGEPLYVVAIEPQRHRVVVGPRSALGVRLVPLREINWLGPVPDAELDVTVKLRSSQPPLPARLHCRAGGAEVILAEPDIAAPGQACVVYRGERVLGGGFIDRQAPLA